MIHTIPHAAGQPTPIAVIRLSHPRAAIIRRCPDRTLVFDRTEDARMHETALVIRPAPVPAIEHPYRESAL